jgi:hypothetical protein
MQKEERNGCESRFGSMLFLESTYQVDTNLSQIRIELARETQRGGNARHDGRDQVVEVTSRWVRELEGSLAYIVQSLIIDTKRGIRVFDKLVHRERRVIWLNHSVGGLGGWDDTEGGHHAVRELYRGKHYCQWLRYKRAT